MAYVRVPPDSSGKKVYSKSHLVGADNVESQIVHLASGSNAENLQFINARGAAAVSFSEGEPSLDAFGQLRVSNPYPLAVYDHSSSSMDDLFTINAASGGTNTHDIDTASSLLTVTTNTSSSVKRTSNRYHYYTPGIGNFVIQTIAVGDTGKVNNIRRWGYYDDENGLFWEVDENGLNVVIRSSTTGSVVDTKVNITNFNNDNLDGTGLSQFDLDITKANLYWIDFAWLGVGVVRFGVLGSDGSRVVAHKMENPNANIHPYMQTGSLPIRWENFNTGVVASGSELRNICSSVYSQTQPAYTFWRNSDIEETKTNVITDVPLFSIRAKSLYNGKINRVSSYPEELSLYVTGGDVKVDVYWDADLTGATWAVSSAGALEADIAATLVSGGYKMYSLYAGLGSTNIDLSKIFELNDEAICRLADNSDSYVLNFVVTRLTATATNVRGLLSYRELR